MKVFCFVGPVRGKVADEEKALVSLWETSWKRLGWEPIVLTPESLGTERETVRLLKRFARLPSRNKKHLDMWCYARWLAVANAGGGVMSDYDVINYTLKPFKPGELTTHCGTVPCLVSGTREEFLRAVRWFEELPLPSPWPWVKHDHVSDMVVMQQRAGEYRQTYDCQEFGWNGWETARAIHFSNFSMKPKNFLPRHEWIPKIRELQ